MYRTHLQDIKGQPAAGKHNHNRQHHLNHLQEEGKKA